MSRLTILKPMPTEKPSPKAADTTNKAASSLVSRKPLKAVAWAMELHSSVCRPPIRSAAQPQNWRATKALPSSTDNMAAPICEANPKSPQKATICCDGMAMGTQQQKIATDRMIMARFGDSPRTGAPAFGSCPPPAFDGSGCGGGPRKIAASAKIAAPTNNPNTSIVRRQPDSGMPAWNTIGQNAPASDRPEA